MAALALSACWGFLIFGISYYAWHAQLHAQAVCFPLCLCSDASQHLHCRPEVQIEYFALDTGKQLWLCGSDAAELCATLPEQKSAG